MTAVAYLRRAPRAQVESFVVPSLRSWPMKRVAAWINASMPGYRATAEPWTTSTDRKVRGSRLRWPGKGREGYLLEVWKGEERVLRHNSGETYRSNDEVERWIRGEVLK